MIITIDTDELKKLTADASDIFVTPEAETAILRLIEIKALVDEADKEAKATLEAKALELNPNFANIKSDKVRVYYRAFGSRYSIDQDKASTLSKELLKVKYEPIAEEIEKLTVLPEGITENEQKKSIVYSARKVVGE